MPKAGEIWRHFKGKEYRILHMGTEVETGVPMVVYERVDDSDTHVWCRMLSNFREILDHKHYPEADQIHRFEKVK